MQSYIHVRSVTGECVEKIISGVFTGTVLITYAATVTMIRQKELGELGVNGLVQCVLDLSNVKFVENIMQSCIPVRPVTGECVEEIISGVLTGAVLFTYVATVTMILQKELREKGVNGLVQFVLDLSKH